MDGKLTYLDILNVDIFHTCLLRGTWRLSIYNSQQQCLMIRLNIDTLQLFWWATWWLHICSQTILASPFKRWNTIEKTVIYHDISQPFISDIHAFFDLFGDHFSCHLKPYDSPFDLFGLEEGRVVPGDGRFMAYLVGGWPTIGWQYTWLIMVNINGYYMVNDG